MRRRRRGRAWRLLGWAACGAAALLAAAATGGYLWLRSSLPQTAGSIALPGLAAPVDVVRDRRGIPHIRARTDGDAYLALGFVHAQDRFFQMELMRRLGAGRLAEIMGSAAVGIDRRMRIFGLYRLAEAAFDHLGPETRAALAAYAEGVNAYIDTHPGVLAPELAILLAPRPEPWRPADSLVWGRLMAMRLSENMWTEALRAGLAERLEPERIDELWPDSRGEAPPSLGASQDGADPEFFDALLRAWPPPLAPVTASNVWAVSGRHTETGRPILANDPHLGFSAPILWYLARVETPTLSASGATVPGVPFTILGHNGTLAWGFTTTDSDTQDLFIEEIDPEDPGRYLAPDGSRAFDRRVETIEVRGGAPVEIEVRATRHGPVVSDLVDRARRFAGAGRVVALAATALRRDDRTAEAIRGFNRAASWGDFIDAARHLHAPQQNVVYADTAGNIGLISPGRVPIRRSGRGLRPASGRTGAQDWIGLIPFEALPRSFNPADGRLVNANHPVVGPDYLWHLGVGDTPPYRAQRIHRMIDAGMSATPEGAGAMQNDTVSLAARELVPLMTAIAPEGETAARAVALLRGWDGRMDAERPEPLIFTAWLRAFNRLLYADETGPLFPRAWALRPVFVREALRGRGVWCDDAATPAREDCDDRLAEALDRALAELASAYGEGPEEWRWGAAHYARFRHPLLGRIPILDRIGDIRVPSGGGAFTVNRAQHRVADRDEPFASVHGPGLRAVYDLDDLDRSLFVVATGQSGNPLSAHYRDLTPLWAAGRYVTMERPADGDPDTRTLRLLPAPGQAQGNRI